MKKVILPFVILTSLLAGCGNTNTPINDTNIVKSNSSQQAGLPISQNVPDDVKREIIEWYSNLPSDFRENTAKTTILFTSKNGRQYITNDRMKFRTGHSIVANGIKGIMMDDTGEILSYIGDSKINNNLTGQSTNYGGCGLSNGPYYRDWSQSGYTGISSGLNINTVNYPSQLNGRNWSINDYIGGQASNGQTEVDAGITYQPQTGTTPIVSAFTNVNGKFNFVTGTIGMALGNTYTAKLEITSANSIAFKITRSDGTTLISNVSAYGFNTSGTDQYFKRMVSISNGSLSSQYDGSTKYSASVTAYHSGTQLASNGTSYYRNWSSSNVNGSTCQKPTSSMVRLSTGTPTSDTIGVTIDMTR